MWVCTYLEGGEGLQKSVLGLAGMWREAQRAADIRSHVGRSTGCCRTLFSGRLCPLAVPEGYLSWQELWVT